MSLKTYPCPICQKPAIFNAQQNPFRPFCSERCKMIDLGEWASEGYKVAAAPAEKDSEESSNKQC